MKSYIDMEELNQSIPEKVKRQLEAILKESELPVNENSFLRITESWLMKQALYNKITEQGEFEKAEAFKKSSNGGCIAVTLSGSILSIGPKSENGRKVVYTSIDRRNDVPRIIEEDDAELSDDISVGKLAHFSCGKIKSTSEIYNLSLPKIKGSEEEEINKIIEINKLLLENFLQVDKYSFKGNYYDNELSMKNDLFKRWIINEWFFIGGFDKHVFMARTKILWLELFSRLYKELVKNKVQSKELEEVFIEFTNVRFAKFIDDYKWYESEKKNFDIGLFRALEKIPSYKIYWDYLENYLNEILKKF